VGGGSGGGGGTVVGGDGDGCCVSCWYTDGDFGTVLVRSWKQSCRCTPAANRNAAPAISIPDQTRLLQACSFIRSAISSVISHHPPGSSQSQLRRTRKQFGSRDVFGPWGKGLGGPIQIPSSMMAQNGDRGCQIFISSSFIGQG
jgi:hypothetical protein